MTAVGHMRRRGWQHEPLDAGLAARTGLIMAALAALLGIGGWTFGGTHGMYAMLVVGLIINFGSYWLSDRIALRAHGAQLLAPGEVSRLDRIVDDVARRAEIPAPRIYLIPSRHANAFATGRGPDHAAVAVTVGLLELLDDRELQGVLAHELSHVRNRDVLVATVAAGIAGAISSIGYVLQWGALLGNRGRERRGSGLAALAWIVVAPLLALLLQLAISRSREYGADATGARLTGDPDALADALQRIELAAQQRPYGNAGPATAHLFIVNPLHGGTSGVLALLSTHPPTEERIARLRAMRRMR